MARIRRDRWRREQFLDVGFNVAIAAVVLGVFTVWMIMDRSGLSAISRDIVALLGASSSPWAGRWHRRWRSTPARWR